MASPGTIEPRFLSASTNGRQIKVAATSTPGTLLHTAVSGTAEVDFVTLKAVSLYGGSGTVTLTIEWGGTTDPDDQVEISLTALQGEILVIDKRMLNNGLAVRAFASQADVVCIYGEVRRVTL